MATTPHAIASTSRPRTSTLWAMQLGLVVVIGGGGAAKLAGDPAMITLFADIGAGQWLRYLTGFLEVLGAVGLLAPRLRVAAAVGLSLLLVAAALINLGILATSPVLPLAPAALTAVVGYQRFRERAPVAVRSWRASRRQRRSLRS